MLGLDGTEENDNKKYIKQLKRKEIIRMIYNFPGSGLVISMYGRLKRHTDAAWETDARKSIQFNIKSTRIIILQFTLPNNFIILHT